MQIYLRMHEGCGCVRGMQAPVKRSQMNMRPSSLPEATAQSPGPTKATSLIVSLLMWPL